MSFAEPRHLNLTPILDYWLWQEQSACSSPAIDPELFFVEETLRGKKKKQKENEAKKICRKCPVVKECLLHALTVPELYGIWGGMTAEQRRAVVRDQNQMTAKMIVTTLTID